MPLFIMSMSWSEQGIRTIKDWPKRMGDTHAFAKKVGVEVKEAACREPRLAVGEQPRGDARTARRARDIELIKLVVLEHAQSERCACRAHDARVAERRREPLAKTRKRARLREARRRKAGMRVLPAVVPEQGQVIDLARLGRSDGHQAA
jgi:hypothetical protein